MKPYLVLLFAISAIFSLEPKSKLKDLKSDIPPKYICKDEGTTGLSALCMDYVEERREYYVLTCDQGLTCIENYNEFDRFNDFDPKENKVCKSTTEKKPYGFSCSANEECASGNCKAKICRGLDKGASCISSYQCNPKLYCTSTSTENSGTCNPVLDFYEKCDKKFKGNDCKIGSFCHSKNSGESTCIQFFSLPLGEVVEDFRLCKSGMAFINPENGSLTCGTRKLVSQTSDECTYQINFGNSKIIKETKSKISSFAKDDPIKDCEKDSDDPYFLTYLEKYKSALMSGYETKPTVSRFHVDPEIKRNFFKRLSYPRFEDADSCVSNFFFEIPKTDVLAKIFEIKDKVITKVNEVCAELDKINNKVVATPVAPGLSCLKQIKKAAESPFRSIIRYLFDWDTGDYANAEETNGGDIVKFHSQKEKTLLAPGFKCTTNDECGSNICTNNICVGLNENSKCNHQTGCGVGLYCNNGNIEEKEGTCVKIKQEGETCAPDYKGFDCEIGTLCHFLEAQNQYKCTKLFSLGDGEKVDDFRLCKSGHVFPSKAERNLDVASEYFCGIRANAVESNGRCLYDVRLGSKGSYVADKRLLHALENSNTKKCALDTSNSDYQENLEKYKICLKKRNDEMRTTTRRFDVPLGIRNKLYKYLDYPRYEGMKDKKYNFFLGEMLNIPENDECKASYLNSKILLILFAIICIIL